ncbi:hypothetical protein B5V01_35130 [Mesorhizobium erdmanii]|uniref:Uncharacterized protein n=2 Tax=Mesorhizobium TaxID=68287 RepID=A0A3M9XFE1_9HYPH|nr:MULTISPECIES: hypothetical protein [Mesorhizobium]RNJ46743.1 hypothetical protein DNR46_02300 [Mesorhizobium japonicum]RXT34253.1 hypothetical protein B5V01_35130 [Mesorhizobium erdmanii]
MHAQPLRVLTLLARHGTEKYPTAWQDLRAMFAHQMPDVAHRMLVIDNSLPVGHGSDLDHGVELIGASNEDWEFSAWDCGINHTGAKLHHYDLIHLATSAFAASGSDYLKLIDAGSLRSLLGLQGALGCIDSHREAVSIFGIRSQAWLRSSFILMNPRQLSSLGSLVSVGRDAPIFSGNPRQPFRDDAPISQAYQQLLLHWLTGDGAGKEAVWHSRFDLTPETLPFFESKTRAILNELMLTNRLLANGCPLVDVTWLAQRARAASTEAEIDIPDWRVQISARARSRRTLTQKLRRWLSKHMSWQ